MPLDFLAMGQGEGPGCYCDVNRALAAALELIGERYALIVIDNEAGLEHLGRRRLDRVDFFLAAHDAQPDGVGGGTAHPGRCPAGGDRAGRDRRHRQSDGRTAHTPQEGLTVLVPHSSELSVLDLCGRPVVELPDGAPARLALWPIVERLCRARPAPPAGC